MSNFYPSSISYLTYCVATNVIKVSQCNLSGFFSKFFFKYYFLWGDLRKIMKIFSKKKLTIFCSNFSQVLTFFKGYFIDL